MVYLSIYSNRLSDTTTLNYVDSENQSLSLRIVQKYNKKLLNLTALTF